jgi:lysophospholipase L1-like esterase
VAGDSSSYGFAPWFNIGTGSTLSVDIHNSNNIAGFAAVENEGATNTLCGSLLRSNASGGVIDYTVPTFQSTMRIFYIQQPGGGTFEIVSVDTAVVESSPLATIDTNGAQDNFKYVDVPISDNGLGSFRYRVKSTSSGVVDVLAGASYIANIEHSVVNNFSNSGRKLMEVDEAVIAECIRGAQMFICALGHNDFALADANDTDFDAFKQRIDWIIQYSNTYNTKVYYADFAWLAGAGSRTRAQMKRIETECPNGTYIPLPDYIRADDTDPDGTYLTTTLNLWEDNAHPNVNGNQWLFETIAKEIGLGVTTKKQCLEYFDYWMPIQIDGGSNLKNTFNTNRLVSSSKRSGSVLHVKIYIEQEGQAQFPVGVRNLQNSWNSKYGYSVQHNVSCSLAFNTSAGALVHQINSTAGGVLRLNTLSLDLKDAIGTFILPIA